MIVFPNAKINIGLNIVAKRPDGYHNIETVFYPISLCDALEVIPSDEKTDISLTVTGIPVEGDSAKNLVVKSYRLMQTMFPLGAVTAFLHKNIPSGAGLGGGSSDASSMLMLLKKLFSLSATTEELAFLASSLGADCPFFLYNKPLFAKGIGNEFEPIDFSLKGYHIVLIKPDILIPTVEAYALVKPAQPEHSLKQLLKLPVSQWRDVIKNDFEKSVFAKEPVIEVLKNELYERGAVYAAMSGSGSSVFGLFEKEISLTDVFPNCFIWQGICEV